MDQPSQSQRNAPPPAKQPPAVKRSPERRKGSSQLSGVQIMFAAILAVGLILAINFSTRLSASRPLNDLYDSTLREIDQLRLEQAQLYEERDYALSDAYVERWAREGGKMVRPGEVLVVPLSVDVLTAPTADPPVFVDVETSPPRPSTWELWWSLFFDTPPPSF
ncbi:MAG: hypothetical protein ACOCXR_01810 [Phototrophicaceae bacterium]